MNFRNAIISTSLYLLLPLQSPAQQIKIGTYIFTDGAEYQGEIVKGKPWGLGRTVFRNGDFHEGHYEKGKRSGHGVYQFADGEKYEGE